MSWVSAFASGFSVSGGGGGGSWALGFAGSVALAVCSSARGVHRGLGGLGFRGLGLIGFRVEDTNPALPIIENMYTHKSRSLGSLG